MVKSKKFQLKTESNKRFLLYHLTNTAMPYMGYEIREFRQSNTCPLKKNWFSIVFKSFGRQKLRLRSTTTLPMQLSNRQADPTYARVETESQSYEKQRAMGNV